MKAILLAVVGLLAVCLPASATQCHVNPVNIPREWVTMHRNCRMSMRQQIQMEVAASLQYLAMGAYFSKDVVSRPGFAKMFFEAASEEREHAMKLIEYLLMRGELTTDVTTLLQVRAPERKTWEGGVEALEHALRMESEVTKSIRNVIKSCEDDSEFNDYHLVDYLTGDFLEEQYKGQRDIAGKTSTLKKLLDRHAALGEFIFDKKLLGIDIVNRPGFAKMFFEAASEEREHAIKLIEYLLMRGELTNDVTTPILTNIKNAKGPERKTWEGGVDALEHALSMESEVTKSIRNVIKLCEDDKEFNDYHLVDYLTGDFLEEQYKGQRDIAGKTSTLKKLLDRHGALGEFIFDKKLLGIDI